MKAVKIIKKYGKKILLAIGVVIAVILGYSLLHDIGTAQRNYEAIGGEIFVFLVPYLIYVVIKNAKDTKEAYKNR